MPLTRRIPWLAAMAALLLSVFLAANRGNADSRTAKPRVQAKEAVFDLHEFRVLECRTDPDAQLLWGGEVSWCLGRPAKIVKSYPKLQSDRPWFGVVVFDRKSDNHADRTFHYVVDESKGTGKGYDRLYFDENRNLDLTDDPVLEPLKEPPPGGALSWKPNALVCFNYLPIEFDRGGDLGKAKVEVMPRLVIKERGSKEKEYVWFTFTPTVARKGRIRIGSRRYDVVLGRCGAVCSRLDLPDTAFYLTPVDHPGKCERWYGGDRLGVMRNVDGQWYSFSATPDGDKLTVIPYRGELGVFEIGPGKRDVETFGIQGILRSNNAVVPVGDLTRLAEWSRPTRRCSVPVGRYRRLDLQVQYGSVEFKILENDHSKKPVRGITIRKDKPVSWEFSEKPTVVFTRPAEQQVFRPGDNVIVTATLIDPDLDVAISWLRAKEPIEDTPESQKSSTEAGELAAKTTPRMRDRPLTATMTITDSSGKEVFRGKLPSG